MKEDHQETPHTAAGRDLLSVLAPDTVADNSPSWTLAILAIEAEAAARQVTELRAAVEALREPEPEDSGYPGDGDSDAYAAWQGGDTMLDAVLALLSAGDKAETPRTGGSDD